MTEIYIPSPEVLLSIAFDNTTEVPTLSFPSLRYRIAIKQTAREILNEDESPIVWE